MLYQIFDLDQMGVDLKMTTCYTCYPFVCNIKEVRCTEGAKVWHHQEVDMD